MNVMRHLKGERMIRLFDDWVILVDDMNYTLARELGESLDKKSGKMRMRYKTYGYYGSLANAIKALSKEMFTEELKYGSYTLEEACAVIKESNERIEALLNDVMKAIGEES